MSTFQQFFPGGGGSSSGGGSNIGGGTTPVEIIAVSGGGGGGGNANTTSPGTCPTGYNPGTCRCTGGCGGTGAILYADNYFINPGTTYPIIIGAGGAAGTSNNAAFSPAGSNGGATSFNNPLCKLHVEGGGGGGGSTPYSCICTCCPDPIAAALDIIRGRPGGTGGAAGMAGNVPCCVKCLVCPCREEWKGKGKYHQTQRCYTIVKENHKAMWGYRTPTTTCIFCCTCDYTIDTRSMTTNNEVLKTPFGWMGGFDAGCACNCSTPVMGNTFSGGMLSNIQNVPGNENDNATCPALCRNVPQRCAIGEEERYYTVNWGDRIQLGNPADPGQVALGGNSATNGTAGILLIRYPDQGSAASSFPGGTDVSPTTPGYYTYCFTTSGSITI